MHGLSIIVGALLKKSYDEFKKERAAREKAKVEEPDPILEAHCVGPLYSDNMEAIMDPDWMNKPRHRPGVAIRRIR